MRYPGWILLLLVCITLCGCGQDPIVGKWQQSDSMMPVTFDFQANGTVTVHFDIEKAVAAAEKKMPGSSAKARPYIENAAKQMEAAKVTWKRDGAVYSMTAVIPGDPSPQIEYLKLEKDGLLRSDKDGATQGNNAMLVRAK